MNSFLRSYEIDQPQNPSRQKISPCSKGKNCDFCNGVTSRLKKESRFTISHQDSCSSKVVKDGFAFGGESEKLNDSYEEAMELMEEVQGAQKWTPQSANNIDDDDGEEEEEDSTGELDSDASTGKRFRSASGRMQKPVRLGDVYGKDYVSRMQKHNETFSAKAADRSCSGLYGAGSESSDTDCEVMKKVSQKRKRLLFTGQFCRDEHVNSAGLHSNEHKHIDFGVENRTKQHGEGLVYSGSSNGFKDDSYEEWFYFDPKTDDSFKDSDQRIDKENFTSLKPKSMEETHSFRRSSDIEHGEKTSNVKVSPCLKSKNCNFCNGVSASMCKKELGGEDSKFMSFHKDACYNQVENDDSALRSKDENSCEVNSNFASNERHVNGDASNVRDLSNEKEKLKESDEDKQSMEEKVAFRQQKGQTQERFEPYMTQHWSNTQSTKIYPSMNNTPEDEGVQPHKQVDVTGGKNKGATHLDTSSHASIGGSPINDPMMVANMASRLAAVEQERQELQSKVDQMAETQTQMFALLQQQSRPPLPPLPLSAHHYGGHQFYYMPPVPQQLYHGMPPPFTQQHYWPYYPYPLSQSQMQPQPEL